MAGKTISIRLTLEEGEKVRAGLRAIGDDGKAALKGLEDATARVPAAANDAGKGVDSLRQRLGGLGLQLQDVGVQAQSGTAALTILGQQGPQIASLFGPAGAIAGAGIVMAAFAAQLAIAAVNGKGLSDVFKEIEAGSKLADEAAKSRVRGLEEEATRLNALAASYRDFNNVALVGERVRLSKEREDLERATRSTLSSVDSGFLGVSSVRNAARFSADYEGASGPSAAERAALDNLSALNDVASITRARVLEVAGALEEASRANGPFASSLGSVRDQLLAQIGPLTEAGEKARSNAANLRLIEEASSGASQGVTQVGNSASATSGQIGGLNTALDQTRQRLLALAQERIASPFGEVEASLARIASQRAALERGGTEAFQAEQRRQSAQGQVDNRVEADVKKLEEALRAASVSGEEITRRLTEARGEFARLRGDEATQQAQLLNDVDTRRKAEADARREATAGRAAGRRADREAEKERRDALKEELEIQRQIYAVPQLNQSGLLALTRSDEVAIREIQQTIRGRSIDPEAVRKLAAEAEQITNRYYEQQQKKAEQTYDRITDYAGTAFADMLLTNEKSWDQTWKNLQRTAVATLAKIVFEAAARPVLMPVIQVVQGIVGGGGGVVGGYSGSVKSGAVGGGNGVDLMGYAQQAYAGRSLAGMFDGASSPLAPGYSFGGGAVGRFDSFANTNIGGFLDTPVYGAVSGDATNAALNSMGSGVYGPATAQQVANAGGNTLTYGGGAAGGLSIVGGAYGIYSGIQTGGAKGFAQGVSGAAGVAGGAAGIAAGSAGALGIGAGATAALGAIAAVAPYIAIIAAVVAMLLPAQKPSNREENITTNTLTGTIETGGQSGDKFSQANADRVKEIADGLNKVAAEVGKAAGLGAAPDLNYKIGAGDRDGIYFQSGPTVQRWGSDVEGGPEALADAALSAFITAAQQQTPDTNVRTLLSKSTDRNPSNTQAIMADLSWYNDVYKVMAGTAEQQTQWARGLVALKAPSEAAIEKAKTLGLETQILADKMAEAVAKTTKARDLQLASIGIGLDLELAQSRGGTGFDQITALQRAQFEIQAEGRRDALKDQLFQMGAAAEEIAARLRTLDDITTATRTTLERNLAASAASPRTDFWAASRAAEDRGYLDQLMGLRLLSFAEN